MNVIELEHALRQLRLGGMASVLETRLRQAQAEPMTPIDLISCLVSDELTRRSDRLLERRRKQAGFRDPDRTLDNFDFSFNPKMNRSLVFDLATGAFINKREDALFLGPGGTGKSHLAQAIGQAAIQQGCKVFYRETHILLDELAEAVANGTRKEYMESVATVPLLIIDDFGMRKLPHTAAEDLLEIIMRRYERFSTLLTSNRPVDDCGKFARRRCRSERHARSAAAPRSRTQVRPTELAHQGGRHCIKEKSFFRWGLCPHAPGIYRFGARMTIHRTKSSRFANGKELYPLPHCLNYHADIGRVSRDNAYACFGPFECGSAHQCASRQP